MKCVFVPAQGIDDWRRCLADPQKHWRDGYSAKCLAECWEAADGLPHEVAALFSASADPNLRDVDVLLAFPEYQVHIPGGGHPSQTDLMLLAGMGGGLALIAVEGKVNESFGPTLGEWRADLTPGKAKRLAYLQEALGLQQALDDHIRYQLLHRLGSAVYEANRFGAARALLVVHSFSPTNTGFEDYREFLALFAVDAGDGGMVSLGQRGGLDVHCGWVKGVLPASSR